MIRLDVLERRDQVACNGCWRADLTRFLDVHGDIVGAEVENQLLDISGFGKRIHGAVDSVSLGAREADELRAGQILRDVHMLDDGVTGDDDVDNLLGLRWWESFLLRSELLLESVDTRVA